MAADLRVPTFVPFVNRITHRVLRLGAFMGPNALLTVRGRRTGEPRTTPVAVVEMGGRRWIIGTFGPVNWVRNLRAAGEGTLSVGRRTERVRAVELDPAEATSFFTDVIGQQFGRTRLGRWMLGSLLRAGEILDDPGRAAERRPVFELHPVESARPSPASIVPSTSR
jgi:deazaflavin-dependent oxidoreductase (nitroreductase family)